MIKLNDKYTSLFDSPARFFVVTGGRGSGKSWAVTFMLTLLSMEAAHRILFTRYTMRSAHLSIIPEFQEKIHVTENSHAFNITKDVITNKFSNVDILFRGLKTSSGNQTAALKSLQGITTWVLDEAEELDDESIFDKIQLSVRKKGVQNRIILILNPATKEHFIYKKFFEGRGVNPGHNGTVGDTTYIHTTYLDNIENLSEDFVRELERIKETNPEKYEHVILGGWRNRMEGTIFNNWKVGNFVEGLPTVFGQDFGFSVDPTTLIECAFDRSRKIVYVREHLYKAGLKTSEISKYNNIYAKKGLIVADNAEPRLITELRDAGNNIKGVQKPKITDSIALMSDWLIVVEPTSTNVVRELNNWIWHDKKSETPIDMYNHLLDALRYAFWEFIGKKSGVYDVR